MRAVVLAASAVAVFLYFIRAILLPFLLAAIVAYICTPLLDWLARRTRWPRLLFAIAAFLIIVGIAGSVLAYAAQHLVAEARNIAVDLPGMLERLMREGAGRFAGQEHAGDALRRRRLGVAAPPRRDSAAGGAGYNIRVMFVV